MVEHLFKWGIDSISVNADAALKISELIKKMEDENIKSTENFVSQNNQINKQVFPKKKNPRIVKCAECGKETRLPFMPRKNKRYFCKKCYFKRKNANKNLLIEKKSAESLMPNIPDTKEELKPINMQDIKEQKEELKKEVEKTILGTENTEISAKENIIESVNTESLKTDDLKEDIGEISPIDNLEHVKDSAEDILNQVEDYNEKKLEENQEIENKIETSSERVDEEIKEEKTEENSSEKDESILPLDEEDYNTENTQSNDNSFEDEYEKEHKNEYLGFGEEYEGF